MDAANDIIGVITVVNHPHIVKDKTGKEYQLFKFSMRCGDDREIPVTAWDEDIPRIKPFIRTDHIIHFDALFARSQDSKYSSDGKDYIFTVRSNTRLNVLGIKRNEMHESDGERLDEYSDLQECMDITKKIDLEVYVKSNGFQPDGSDNTARRIGLVTDLKHKMNLVIFSYDNDKMVYEQGQKVKLRGKMNISAVKPTFNVQSLKDVEIINGEKVGVNILRKINKFPKSCAFEDDTCTQAKVAKKD